MIISIASGKGGTGKTTVATNLAVVLSEKSRVTLVDADVEEPNDNIFLRAVLTEEAEVCQTLPAVDLSVCTSCGFCEKVCSYHAIMVAKSTVLIFPEMCHACGGCALLCPAKAIHEVDRPIGKIERGFRGPLEFAQGTLNPGEVFSPSMIRKLKSGLQNTEITLVDCPPGTSCSVVASVKGSDLCLFVTEPTPFGLHDLQLAVEMLGTLKIPCAVVINRDGVGDQAVEQFCTRKALPLLARLPLEREAAECYAHGRLLVEHIPAWRERFQALASALVRLAIFNSKKDGGEHDVSAHRSHADCSN